MANVKGLLDDILRHYETQTRQRRLGRSAIKDDFLNEADQVRNHISSFKSYLDSIRKAYLSTAPLQRRHQQQPQSPSAKNAVELYLSSADKASIDASSKQLLRDLSASLTQLSSAESIRRDTEARKLRAKYDRGFLGRWAAGGLAGASDASSNRSEAQLLEEGCAETVRHLRESVLWYLGRKLEEVGETQRDMMERRLERDLEKGRSILYQVRDQSGRADSMQSSGLRVSSDGSVSAQSRASSGSHDSAANAVASAKSRRALEIEEETKRQIEQQLTPEQLQLFAQENSDMLKQYEDTLDQVRTAERSMLEISELQSQLVANLDTQSSNISQLVADSLSTTENVGGGNKQLKRATERKSTARMVFYASCGLCGFLITWDLIF